ncbi:DUF305 domain-containing protein [Natronoglycomyces albus]|uniref:DUF305 domain-containing protein n=1 Tax=Natronoglycomyces albus TaxID=2811108 RepID=A0A895XK76_9ACTN|nr:DUF305 domain-containing protein [Natronoglycomyces albus]QSB06151.1 DUF305 domain-containing protein [Natronoglycomyces albus]
MTRPVIYLVCTALASFVAGASLMVILNASSPGEDSAEAGFARDMSTHHAQAVAMSMHQWHSGEDEALRAIAYDIATGQQAEIGMMSEWLRDWNVSMTSSQPPMAWAQGEHAHDSSDGLMPGLATPQQLEEFYALEGRDADIMFAELMIRHHIGGVDMAEAALASSSHDDVTSSARRMAANQKTEIRAMEMHLERILEATSADD